MHNISHLFLLNAENILDDSVKQVSTFWQHTTDWINDTLLPYIPQFLISVVVLLIGWFVANLLSKLISRVIKRFKMEQSVCSFITSFLNILFKVLVIVSFLALLGINITAIVAALGAAGVAVALALQNNLSNVASGLIILITRPFKVGDFIEYDGTCGTVKDIQIMFTHLNMLDNKLIVIPNSNLTANRVINYTAEQKRRVDIDFSISYDNDFEKAKKIICGVVDQYDKAYKEPAPIIRLGDSGESALIIHARVWCDSTEYWNAFYDITEAVKHAFDENGITVPYNQLDVHIDSNDEKSQTI